MIIVLLIVSILFLLVLHQQETRHKKELKAAREDALKKSRAVLKGQISEQLAPFLKGFPYNASDLKFFGNGFDYICVVNMAEARDTDVPIKEIVFIDIKTGKANLSVVQRKIRDAIVDGRVAWETITVLEDNSVSIKRASKKSNEQK